ncbi:hypothetical protein Bbelb_160080 [Branchiostoma belcheri]|nr:hypothetical protein Bbelb_160080 [Branchiostoma belcheri]
MGTYTAFVEMLLLAVVTVHHVSCSPCKPPVAELCSCKDGLLDSGETCTVCACSQDGNYRQCTRHVVQYHAQGSQYQGQVSQNQGQVCQYRGQGSQYQGQISQYRGQVG